MGYTSEKDDSETNLSGESKVIVASSVSRMMKTDLVVLSSAQKYLESY